MRINIQNKPKKISAKTIRDAIGFFASKLKMHKNLLKNITITVVFEDLGAYKGFGYPEHLEDRVPRDFIVEVNHKFSKSMYIKTIAHEMVHVKQYAKGELKDREKTPKIKWKEKLYASDADEDEDYWLAPWEIEAYGYEVGLTKLWNSHVRKQSDRIEV